MGKTIDSETPAEDFRRAPRGRKDGGSACVTHSRDTLAGSGRKPLTRLNRGNDSPNGKTAPTDAVIYGSLPAIDSSSAAKKNGGVK